MDFAEQGIVYALLIIPTLFSLVVLVQGIEKVSKDEKDGPLAIGFGMVFLFLITAVYFLFIR